MTRSLVWVLLLAALSIVAVRLAPSDGQAIRSLTRHYLSARAAGDHDRAYRLVDLDFRSLCPPGRYRESFTAGDGDRPRLLALPVRFINGERAEGDARIVTATGERWERWQYVKEGGRWFVYEDVTRCGVTL